MMFKVGYHEGYYNTHKISKFGTGERGGSGYTFGRDFGIDDRESGLMNSYEPKIKSNNPTYLRTSSSSKPTTNIDFWNLKYLIIN